MTQPLPIVMIFSYSDERRKTFQGDLAEALRSIRQVNSVPLDQNVLGKFSFLETVDVVVIDLASRFDQPSVAELLVKMNKKQVVFFVHEQESKLVDLRASFCTGPDEPRSIFVDGSGIRVDQSLEKAVVAYVYRKDTMREINYCLDNLKRLRGDATRLIEESIILIKKNWLHLDQGTQAELLKTFDVEVVNGKVLAALK